MDFQITAFVIASGAALPYVIEILWQVPLLARVMSALPADRRASLPPHPRQPWLAVFGSTRFFWALFRYAIRNDNGDSVEIAMLKRKMRASVIREAIFGIAFVATVVVLWRLGWRPLSGCY